jgi:molybdate transport system ATP-binding protein
MIGSPRTILIDEPLEALDRAMRAEVLAWLDRLRAAGALLVIVTHDIDPFAASAARAITVRRGLPVTRDPLPAEDSGRLAILESLARGTAGP